MPGARWFPGAALNYAEHALSMPGPAIRRRRRDRRRSRATASASRRTSCATASRAAGRGCSGSASAGATAWPRTCPTSRRRSSRCSRPRASAPSGRRARPSSAREPSSTGSARSSPRVLLTIDGYRYGDRDVDRRGEVAEIRAALPSLRADGRRPVPAPGAGASTPSRTRSPGTTLLADPAPLAFEHVPFDHPLYVLFSSGTTGLPKAHRPRARRHPPRAPQGPRPPHGPRARRTASAGSRRPAG